MGGGGCGGSKIKLKIKACPEPPSAPHGLPGRVGVAAGSSPSAVTGAVCPSLCPVSCQAPARAAAPAPQALLPHIGRSAINGARGAPGAGRDQRGPKRRMLGQKQRFGDGETETERHGDRDVGRRDVGTQRHKNRVVWRRRDVRTQGRRDMGTQRCGAAPRTVRADMQGRGQSQRGWGPVPVGLTGHRRGTETGEEAGRDLEMAEMRAGER